MDGGFQTTQSRCKGWDPPQGASQRWLQVFGTHAGQTEAESSGCCHTALPDSRPLSWNRCPTFVTPCSGQPRPLRAAFFPHPRTFPILPQPHTCSFVFGKVVGEQQVFCEGLLAARTLRLREVRTAAQAHTASTGRETGFGGSSPDFKASNVQVGNLRPWARLSLLLIFVQPGRQEWS